MTIGSQGSILKNTWAASVASMLRPKIAANSHHNPQALQTNGSLQLEKRVFVSGRQPWAHRWDVVGLTYAEHFHFY